MRALLLIAIIVLPALASVIQAQDDKLPSCTPVEFAAVHASLAEMTAFFHRASTIRTMDDLLAHSDAHIEWRESYWTNTPLCAESHEIALLANQLIGDFAALALVNSLQDDGDTNPYVARHNSGLDRLYSLIDAVPPPTDAAAQHPARTLRECTDSEYEYLSYTLVLEYGELADIANLVETVEDFIGYVEAQLAWRQDSLTRYPPCVDALEFAWLASQTAADIAALFAYYFIGVPEDEIPYNAPEREGSRRLGELAEEFRAKALPDEVMQAIERELGNPSGGNWRRCTVNELETIQNLLPTYQMLEDMAAGIETPEDHLAYSHAQVVWRENLQTKLARCGEVLEIAWLISENMGDLAIMHALKLLDIPVDESPVFQQVMSNIPGINTWEGLLPTLLASYEPSDGVKPLPACTADELGALKTILTAHLDIFKTHGDIRSIDDLLNFVFHQLAWREFSFSRLPLCYGSFETFLRAYWYASDNAVGLALALADVPDDASPYPNQQSIGQSHIESWYAIVDGIVPPPSAETAAGSPES